MRLRYRSHSYQANQTHVLFPFRRQFVVQNVLNTLKLFSKQQPMTKKYAKETKDELKRTDSRILCAPDVSILYYICQRILLYIKSVNVYSLSHNGNVFFTWSSYSRGRTQIYASYFNRVDSTPMGGWTRLEPTPIHDVDLLFIISFRMSWNVILKFNMIAIREI